MGVNKKSWVSKYKEIPCIFFASKSVKKRGNSFHFFFAKYTRFVWNFLKNWFLVFFSFFHDRYFKNSSRGTKNNQENVVSSFREICEILVKIRFLTKYTRFGRNFLKNVFLFFFTNFYITDTLKPLLRGPKIISVIY